MNYYPFHLGDYAAHTAHLEPMEDLAYRRLLDQYYLREGPLPADVSATAKLVRMRSMVEDVESVLREFFTLTADGWVHGRCDAEIEKMQDKQAKAKASAQASVNARKARSLNGRSTGVENQIERTLNERSTNVDVLSNERSTNAEKNQTDVELPTPTPIPIKEIKEERAEALAPDKPSLPKFDPFDVELPECVSSGAWREWIAYRRQERMSVKPACINAQLQNLRQWHAEGQDPNAIIRRAIASGWRGLFPDKAAQARSSPVGSTATADGGDDRRARIARLAAQVGVSAGAVNA